MRYLSGRNDRTTNTMFLSLTIVMACLCSILASKSCFALDDPLPAQIRDLKLGISSPELFDKIKDSGTYTKGPVPRRPARIRVTWIPPNSTRYKKVQFDFTEKDRLYLVRFVVRDELRWKTDPLKKSFFAKFRISTENPGRMRIKDDDVIIYLPEDKTPFLFDATNTKTGQKTFEIFDKNISGSDKPRPKRSKGRRGAVQGKTDPSAQERKAK